MSREDAQNTNLWVRIGSVDGLKYLAKHFQLVIYSKDVFFEDHKYAKGAGG